MATVHHYRLRLRWTGNRGCGTADYVGYERDYLLQCDGKPDLPGSADPAFRGDAARHNPEDLFVGAIAACHMLFYLALCAQKGLRVLGYEDAPQGWMEAGAAGGSFREIHLAPTVTIAAGSDPALAEDLHAIAHQRCFLANSCAMPIQHRATIHVAIPDPEGTS